MSEAATVAGALAALAEPAEPPEWVLLDLMLPDGCGSEILQHIAEDRLPSKVCVITGCGPEKLAQVQSLGPDVVLKKPVDVTRLLALLTGQGG